MNRKELEQEIKRQNYLIEILWEFISEKDVDKVSKKLRKYE
jgi:hypothetical protein